MLYRGIAVVACCYMVDLLSKECWPRLKFGKEESASGALPGAGSVPLHEGSCHAPVQQLLGGCSLGLLV